MQWPVSRSKNAEAEIAAANFPGIRLFSVERTVSGEPLDGCKGAWLVCTPETVKEFSAVGYYFGRRVHEVLGVPVGLINSSWGGTPAEAWTSRPSLESKAQLQPILARWDDLVANYATARADYDKSLAEWEKAAAAAKANGQSEPKRPTEPLGPDHPHRASGLYNGMIHPLIPYGVGGAIWYQGESNAGRAYQYRTLFPTMIEDWRKNWGRGDFPFLFVQLANFMQWKPDPSEGSAWAELREAQTKTLALPNTGMAVIIDLGEADDIHPTNKQDVGSRLAQSAWKVAFGMDNAVDQGPMYHSMRVDGATIRVKLTDTDGGLIALGGGPVQGFAIAGPDRKFYWADARIEGDEVIVSSPGVSSPVAVRYAWADNPRCNLYNGAGLPACPFRTDDWPGVTVDAK
jgi:sialate O-acetylesterase